jgi:hypothetical protein
MGTLLKLPPAPVLDAPRGRPGDWSEPVDLQVEREVLDRTAEGLGVSPDLLAALLVERELVLFDLCESGLERPRAQALLDEAAAGEGVPAVGPGNLFFGYLHDLRHGSVRCAESSVDRWIMLPLRLHEPLRRSGLTIVADDGEQAKRWELAAASAGLQMREWGLRIALLAR